MEFKGLQSKGVCVCLGLWLGLNAIAAGAVEPVESGDRLMAWSKVIDSATGPVIYDRHRVVPSLFANVLLSAIGVPSSQEQSEVVSRWSRSGIRVTRTEMVQVVDEVVPRKELDLGGKGDRVAKFVYREEVRETSPVSIGLVIKGRSVRYESGPVSAELAALLAGATEGSVSMQLHWPDGSMTESKIGEGTVLGWRQVFR